MTNIIRRLVNNQNVKANNEYIPIIGSNEFLNALVKASIETVTLNGDIAYTTTGDAVLDFFGSFGAMRNESDDNIILTFTKSFIQAPLTTLRLLYYFRSPRGGQGERRIFRVVQEHLAKKFPSAVFNNLDKVVKYGRWDDLFVHLDVNSESYNPEVATAIINMIDNQLANDLMSKDDVSLLAKWMPSINASSSQTRNLANQIRNELGLSPKQYRKMLSELRSRINIVEKLMSENQFDKIEYDKVPSKAHFIYRNAFANHDAKRYSQYLNDVVEGKAKINSKVMYPYEIVKLCLNQESFSDTERKVLDEMWKALPNYCNAEDSLCVVDVSGSMTGRPMSVAIALGMYMAERNTSVFNNKFITFSEKPSLVNIVDGDIVKKVKYMEKANWGANTDLRKVFDLILKVAIKNSLSQEQMVKRLYIISDMQFDSAAGFTRYGHSNQGLQQKTTFHNAKENFNRHGYELPQVVFWNVNDYGNKPITTDDTGTMLISGFSPSILKFVMNNEEIDPMETIKDIVKQYSDIVL